MTRRKDLYLHRVVDLVVDLALWKSVTVGPTIVLFSRAIPTFCQAPESFEVSSLCFRILRACARFLRH